MIETENNINDRAEKACKDAYYEPITTSERREQSCFIKGYIKGATVCLNGIVE